MSVSSGSDITIPIQDSPPPPPSPYAGGGNGPGSKGTNDGGGADVNKSSITIIDTTSGTEGDNEKATPEPRGDVTVTVGFVNEGYADHSPESKQNGHSDKNGKITNGKGNGAISIVVPGSDEKPSGDRTEIHLNEAVNPELINMNILNTIPDKPNPEYGPYDNMDEYFVPVNTHKKFLRSEKLYVTKDKRKESRWKKYVCWLIGASILATIVTVAVLAGIGLIPQKSPNNYDTESVVGTTTETETDSSSSSASASSGDPSADIIISSTSPDSSLPSSTTEINTPPLPIDATYVQTAADINFHITDLNYEPALNDKTSERFQELANQVQNEIKGVLKSRAGLGTVYTRVTEFEPGSVYVKMRIGWLDQSTDMHTVKLILSNVTSVGPYNIMPISTYGVVNLCKFNKNGCSHNCSYDFVSMEFYCFCENDTYYLDEDKKTCLSMYDMPSSTAAPSTTTSTTTEVPSFPEFSSYSPSSSSEEPETSPSPSSEEGELNSSSHETYPTEVIVDQEATEQPEHEHEKEPEQPAASQEPVASQEEEPETSTNADLHSHETEPVSQEHHQSSEEMIVVPQSSTTTTTSTTETPAEVVEHVEEEHHHHDTFVPVAVETTTSTTTTTTPAPEVPLDIPESSEERIQSTEGEEHVEPTVAPQVDGTSHENESREVNTGPQSMEEEDFGRTLHSEEDVKPTEHTPEEVHEAPIAADNATVIESPRDTSSDEDSLIVPTVVPATEEEEEPVHTTFAPQQIESGERSEEESKSQETPVAPVSWENVNEDTTVSPVGAAADENEPEATTVLPGESEKSEEKVEENEQPHLITPMDVLSFSSHEVSSTTTPAPPPVEQEEHAHHHVVTTTASTTKEVSPVEPPVASSNEETEGRSISSSENGSSSDQEGSFEDEVEHVSPSGPVRSQSLTEAEETATEAQAVINGNRAPRLFSTDLGQANQFLTETDEPERDRSQEREELQTPEAPQPADVHGTNATESASVETADEKPETAAAVTSVSSEDTDSREAVTQANNQNDDEPQNANVSQSGSNEHSHSSNIFESSSSSSGSGEFSQESPVTSSSVEDDERPEDEEPTTVAPKSLLHDIDINYLGNNTEDHSNTEQVQPAVVEVESVEGEHVQGNNDQDKEKLVSAPAQEEESQNQDPIPDDLPEATTTQPALPEKDENQPSTSAEERSPVVAVPDPLSHGLEEAGGDSESREEETTRSVTTSSEALEQEDSIEKQNRDNRDANGEIETPSVARTSEENTDNRDASGEIETPSASRTSEETTDAAVEDEVATTSLPEISPKITSSTTTTTTTAAPVPEVIPEELTTTTTTTTTPAPVPEVTPEEVTTTTTTTTSAPVPEVTPEELTSTSTTTTSTTTPPPVSVDQEEPVSSSASNSSNSDSIIKHNDGLSQESASAESSRDNSHHHNSHEFSSFGEDDTVLEPSSSYSSSSSGSNEQSSLADNSSSDNDLHDNELT